MTSNDFEPVRMGVIGCGGMGIRHALAVAEMKALGCRPVEIVAICDSDADRRNHLAAMLADKHDIHVEIFADTAALLESARVEAVDIVLPTSMHHELVLDAVAAEKHVLVEKPLALTVAACDVIVNVANRNNRVVAVSENYRRIASNRAMGQKIRSGELGRLDAMFVRNIASNSRASSLRGSQIVPPAWYHDRNRAGGYLALEKGVHEADLQQFWFGEIDTITAGTHIFGSCSSLGANIDDDMLTATLTFKSGFVSHLLFCSAMPGVSIADRLIIGEETLIHSDAWHAWQGGFVRRNDGSQSSLEEMTSAYVKSLASHERDWLFPSGAWDENSSLSSFVEPLTYGVGIAIYDFARAVRLNMQPEITAEMGRVAVATCFAMQESAHLKAPVKLADVLTGKIAGAQLPLNRAIGLA